MDKELLTQELYEQWRQHPITVLLIEAVTDNKNGFANLMSANAANSAMNDATYRGHGFQLKAATTMLLIITDFEVFKKTTIDKQKN